MPQKKSMKLTLQSVIVVRADTEFREMCLNYRSIQSWDKLLATNSQPSRFAFQHDFNLHKILTPTVN